MFRELVDLWNKNHQEIKTHETIKRYEERNKLEQEYINEWLEKDNRGEISDNDDELERKYNIKDKRNRYNLKERLRRRIEWYEKKYDRMLINLIKEPISTDEIVSRMKDAFRKEIIFIEMGVIE